MNLRVLLVIPVLTSMFVTGCALSRLRSMKPIKPGKAWGFTLKGQNRDVVLDADGVTIHFQGVPNNNTNTRGSLLLTGSGRAGVGSPSGGINFFGSYADEVCTITLNQHTLLLTEEGTKLTIGKSVYSLKGPKKTILVKKDGTSRIVQ